MRARVSPSYERGDTAAIQQALAHGAQPEAWQDTHQYQCTALRLAAGWGTPDAVRILLEAGAAVDTLSNTNRTALHSAAFCNREEAVSLLLAAGADLHLKDRLDDTALGNARKQDYHALADYLQSIIDDPRKRPKPEDVGLDMAKRNAALAKLGVPVPPRQLTRAEKVAAENARRNIEEQGRGF